MKTAIKAVATIAFVVALAFSLPKLLVRPEEATRILADQGYTEIVITGWRPFAAGKDDSFSTGFEARSPGGRKVTGAVTSGFFKGSTIRLD